MFQPDAYFMSLIEDSNILKNFENDLGLQLIAKSLDYKITTTKDIIVNEIRESYNPKTELALLAYLAHKVGYLRLKKPLQIKGTVVSNDYVLLKKDTKFTDGKNLYFLNNDIICNAGVETEATFTLMEKETNTVTVDSGTLFFHIPTNYTYKDLFNVKIYKDGIELKYSQNFIDMNADYSLEIKADGYIDAVIWLNNENGLNIQKGDSLTVEFYTTPDVNTAPTGITIIETGYDLVVKNIAIYKNYAPIMSIDEMIDMIKFGRKSVGDLVMNEDYYQFIMKHFADRLKILKVWQEREQNEESGYSVTNINKVFLAYLTNDLKTFDSQLNHEITDLLYKVTYGKYYEIQESVIYELPVFVKINTNESYSLNINEQIVNLISGYYDDLRNPVNVEVLFSEIYEFLKTQFKEFSLYVNVGEKGAYVNRKIYYIPPEKITVTITGI